MSRKDKIINFRVTQREWDQLQFECRWQKKSHSDVMRLLMASYLKRHHRIIHICLFDLHCWRDWWWMGMPMRVRFGKRQFTVFTGARRAAKAWDMDNPVQIQRRTTFRQEQVFAGPPDAEKGLPFTTTNVSGARTFKCPHMSASGVALKSISCSKFGPLVRVPA